MEKSPEYTNAASEQDIKIKKKILKKKKKVKALAQ